MKTPKVHSIAYSQTEKSVQRAGLSLTLLFWLGTVAYTYHLNGNSYNFWLIASLISVVVGIISFVTYYNYRSMHFDSIASTEKGIVRFDTTKVKFIPYEEITSILHFPWPAEIYIRSKSACIKAPKHKDLFHPFYQQIETHLFERWQEKLNSSSIVIKSNLFRWLYYFIFIIVGNLLIMLCYSPEILFEVHDILADSQALYFLCFFVVLFALISLSSHQKITLEAGCIKVQSLTTGHSCSVDNMASIDYEASHALKPAKIIIEFKNSREVLELDGSTLNFPLPTLYRFIKTYYKLDNKPIDLDYT